MIKHLTIAVLAALAAHAAHACPQAAAQGRGITARVQDIGGSSVGVSGFGLGTKVGSSGGIGASTSAAAINGKTCGQCQKTSTAGYGNVSYGNVAYGTKHGLGVSGIGIAESSDMAERSHGQSHLSTNVDATRNRNAADNFSDLRIDRAEPALPKQLAK